MHVYDVSGDPNFGAIDLPPRLHPIEVVKMRRNIILVLLALAAAATTACSNPTAPSTSKKACGSTNGGAIC